MYIFTGPCPFWTPPMRSFLSPLLLAILVAAAVPAASQDAIHRTQFEVDECRFDLDHNGTHETTYQPQSSNPDCPCYSAGAPARAATEPDWPVIGCGGTSTVGPVTLPVTCPSVEHDERLCPDLTIQARSRSQVLVGGACQWDSWSAWSPATCPIPCQFLVQNDERACDHGSVTQTRARIHSAIGNACGWGPWSAWTGCPSPPPCNNGDAGFGDGGFGGPTCDTSSPGVSDGNDGPAQDLDGDGHFAADDQNDLDASVGGYSSFN